MKTHRHTMPESSAWSSFTSSSIYCYGNQRSVLDWILTMPTPRYSRKKSPISKDGVKSLRNALRLSTKTFKTSMMLTTTALKNSSCIVSLSSKTVIESLGRTTIGTLITKSNSRRLKENVMILPKDVPDWKRGSPKQSSSSKIEWTTRFIWWLTTST